MRKTVSLFICVLLTVAMFCFPSSAESAVYNDTKGEAIGFKNSAALFDGNRETYTSANVDAQITLSRNDGISHIYIEFDRVPSRWKLTNPLSNSYGSFGKDGMLHEYIDVATLFKDSPNSMILTFPAGTVIADVYAFSSGELPDFVQTWQPPCEQADLMLVSSHSDDEQLFFAGVLPYYAIERKLQVQVVYIVQHFEANGVENHTRPHEQLDGLWKVGIRNYPVMSKFPDLYSESKNRDTAFKAAQKAFAAEGISFDDFKEYLTECLRRFKPLVTVSHDLNGEYGHGTHVYCSSALTEAIKLAADQNSFPESAAKYGTWQTEKTYLHLYKENQITMDWDTPLESLGGKTPFEITQEGFGCHKSQHWTWFNRWIYGTDGNKITKASQIKTYSPCQYGLYDTKVGYDTVGGDFMENITTYAERKELEEKEKEAEKKQKFEEAIASAVEKDKETVVIPPSFKKMPLLLIPIFLSAIIILVVIIMIINRFKY